MIRAIFFGSEGCYSGFSLSGHAGMGKYGEDIVCAAVSSALQLTVNGITEIVKANASVSVEENMVSLTLKEDSREGRMFINAFYLHLTLLLEDYPKAISITVSEV